MLIPYTTVKETYQNEIEIKKSKFITTLIPVRTEDEAGEQLGLWKKKYKDATHNCWAYRIGEKRILERSSDDGEPQGTAGHPMLYVLQKQEMTNILAIVTRYFGGIKLGAGGLTRAYGGAVQEALETAPVVHFTPYMRCTLTLPYSDVGTFEHYIKDTDIRMIDRTFTGAVTMTFLTLPECKDHHKTYFRDLTFGKTEMEEIGEEYVIIEKTKE